MVYSNGIPNVDIPLSPAALVALRKAALASYPAQEANPGVVAKLLAHGFAQVEQLPSPYKSHPKGRTVGFLVCADAGREYLRGIGDLP